MPSSKDELQLAESTSYRFSARAGVLYAPSYISFEYALSYYDLIPEAVRSWTSATFGKKRQKVYKTPIGFFFYRDIPEAAFPWEVTLCTEFEAPFLLASAEKALCDQLYTLKPLRNQKDLEYMLFEDMRIEEEDFLALNLTTLCELAPLYHKKNLDLLYKYTTCFQVFNGTPWYENCISQAMLV